MKRKLRQRVMAIFAAVLMVIGTFPAGSLSVVNAEPTDAGGSAADKKAYVFDASDYSPSFDETTGKASITEDTKVGTDDFFTVSATGNKNAWVQLSDGALSCDMGEYTQALQLGGGLKPATGQAGMSFEISSPVKVIVYDAVKKAGFDPYEKKLLGITAMQKLLGKSRFDELLTAYIEKPQGKPTLVPDSDKRPP